MVGDGVDVNFITHLTGLGSSLELGLSGSFGGPSLLEESLWDGDLLVKLVDVLVLHSMSSYDSSSSFLLSSEYACPAVHVSTILLLYLSSHVLILTSWDGTVVDGAILMIGIEYTKDETTSKDLPSKYNSSIFAILR
jgi:hypothetical protein